MRIRTIVLLCLATIVAAGSLFAQFKPRKDYVWARDISVAASPIITIDGNLTEAVWAKADSVMIQYGVRDGNPGSGFKIMNGTGVPGNPANAVLKFLVNKTTNMLYIGVTSKDSSIGGSGWENSDGILGGIYQRSDRSPDLGITLHKDIFVSFVDSSTPNATFNLKGGNLPSRGVIVAAGRINGTSNIDTASNGSRTSDQGWSIEMAVSLDSLGYNAKVDTTDAIQMCMAIWDGDWVHTGGTSIATKAWWGNEWGNNGQGLAARVLVRSDVNVNSTSLPAYGPDMVIPNGINYPAPVIDGDLKDSVWSKIPAISLQYGNAALRATYPTVGKDRSGNFKPKGNTVFDAGMAKVKMFFKGDTLYLGADIPDKSINSYVSDDFFDGVQLNMNVPIDTLYDKNVNMMAAKRFGVAIDSSAGATRGLWDLTDSLMMKAIRYAAKMKPASTINNNSDVDAGYTIEMALNLAKLGYPAGQANKTVAIGVNYHDYDIATDTVAYRTWWFREWPWTSTPAFCVLDNTALVTGVAIQGAPGVANEFRLVGNYPNPFNPSTKIQYAVPEAGIAKIQVYDVLGRLVQTLSSPVQAGMHEQVFQASTLASGMYFYRVEFTANRDGHKSVSHSKTMMLLK